MTWMLTLKQIEAARLRVQHYVRHTPLLPAPTLAEYMHPNLVLKLENMQVSGSFKARGAFNHLLQLSTAERQRGVIAASGGNHGLAVAYAGAQLGIPVTIYLPASASADRMARIQHYGAELRTHGRNWDDAHAQALLQAKQEQRYYIHPFDAERTLEGTGSLGLELLDDVPAMDTILIAIGGGGLIAGIAAAIKQRKPDVRIIGVEPEGASSMLTAVQAGKVQALPSVQSIADTLSPRSVCERTLKLTQRYVDEIVLVSDAAMVEAMRWLWRNTNQLVEPAGAAVIAALQNAKVDISQATHPVALICGGNAAAACAFPTIA